MRRTATTLSALACGAAVLLSGCGSNGDEPAASASSPAASASAQPSSSPTPTVAPAAAIARAAAATARAGSARITLTTTLGDQGSVTARGAYASDPVRLDLTFDRATVAGQTLTGVEERVVDGQAYLRIPALEQRLGAAWLRVPLDAASAGLGSLQQPSDQASAARSLALLQAAHDLHVAGTQQVAGVPTTHYSAAIDLTKAIDALPADQQKAVQAARSAGATGDLAVDVWVDGDGLVRRADSGVTTSAGRVTSSAVFEQYGVPVSVQAPPADQVREIPGLSGSSTASAAPST